MRSATIRLLFGDEALSGGNFHAQPVAFAADMLAMALCEIGSISERRLAVLVDPKMSGLPAFLIEDSGVNSGFMIVQVTAAALVSENKSLAFPASVDTIPTSAGQEDHVSMATHGALKARRIAHNAAGVVGIELLAARAGARFPCAARRARRRSRQARAAIRAAVPHHDEGPLSGARRRLGEGGGAGRRPCRAPSRRGCSISSVTTAAATIIGPTMRDQHADDARARRSQHDQDDDHARYSRSPCPAATLHQPRQAEIEQIEAVQADDERGR